ncbi:ATP-dependent RNA helicase-like protein rok1 [Boeremia exigua]|uniref:ATP-dependent RNA helicase-like protein rok1 n=1 Tax=Boeremia exigua TaxID=749465 RepID=UPI001E8D8EBD|nr:ATP-dependent RNA helicase-like protein rok1 [Boeremia exigua]KAH6643150.1 ATP-dependent RNA helicase-like protein rok1 [Boeremia exigua]
MDVFKLLSRSAKPSAKASATQNLPSSGAAANPQLFGHDGPAFQGAKNKKRKRGQDKAGDAEEDTSIYAALDFFGAPKSTDGEGKKRKKRAEAEKDDVEVVDGAGDFATEVPPAGEAYDAAESKHLLRSHKLKIAVLEDFAAQDALQAKEQKKKAKKDKKGSKKHKEEEPAGKKKDSKKPLYPQPLTDFAQLRTRYAISRRLAENIQEQGYKLPTEVQLGALPLLLGGKTQASSDSAAAESSGAEYGGDIDLLTIAPTGSGKTIAFLIPVINALLREGTTDGVEGPRAIVVAPTRELAAQIVNEARKLAKGTGIKATLMRKGMEVVERGSQPSAEAEADASGDDDSASDSDAAGEAQQKTPDRRRAERVKAAIIVATPLALLNALKRRDGSVADLPSVRHVVLDEADVLLDPLFREQTLAVWNACTNPLLRVGLWSATMGASVESLATSTLNTRWETLKSSSTDLPPRPPLIRLVVGLKDTAIPNIHHQLTYAATEQGKLLGLRQLLHPTATTTTPTLRPPFLVFTQTIPRAIALHSELLYDIPPEAGGSSRLAVLHADLSPAARDAIMTRFRRGDLWVLITTDLLARGIDFRGLNGVVNFDAPSSAAAYVHRVGRTGRAGRAGGVAVTFYTQDDIPHVRLIANVIRASEALRGVPEGEGSVKKWLLDALPVPSKRDKAALKKRGVEGRRSGLGGKEGRKARISTKSGFERRVENRRRGAVEGSRRRTRAEAEADAEAQEGGASEGGEA